MNTLAKIHHQHISRAKPFVAQMLGIGCSYHASIAAAHRGLAKLRRQYRDARNSLPYPKQEIAEVVNFGTMEIEYR